MSTRNNENVIIFTKYILFYYSLVCNKGGVGRSTTAQNVSWKLAEIGYNVLVVDLDSLQHLYEA